MPSFRRALAAGVVDGIVGAAFSRKDHLADGDNVVALPVQAVLVGK
jgi:hypothetical protein